MKNICFLVTGLNAGGIENYVLRFLNYLPDKNNITVVVRDERKGDLYDKYIQTGVNLKFQGVGYINPLKLLRLYKFLKENNFDVVCDFNGNFAGLTILIAKFAGVKKRITFYRRSSNAFQESKLRLVYNRIMNKLVYKHSTDIFSNSRHALHFFFPNRSDDDNRFKVIPNGIDPEIFNIKESKEEARKILGIPGDKFIIGHIGRYDSSKNHKTIFEVAKLLTARNDNLIFVFCGRGTDSKEFLEQLDKFSIKDFCIPLGLQKNIPLVLKSFDLFYFPSITEGQPNALIEAMMTGLPVIASDIPPIKEVIPESGHKFLVPAKDIEASVKIINDLIAGSVFSESLIFKDEAILRFDMNKNFKLFYDELVK